MVAFGMMFVLCLVLCGNAVAASSRICLQAMRHRVQLGAEWGAVVEGGHLLSEALGAGPETTCLFTTDT